MEYQLFFALCLCIFAGIQRSKAAFVCNRPLGMQSGALPNSRVTASSYSNPIDKTEDVSDFAPWQGRLNNDHIWCAHKDKQNTEQWLQVDLGNIMVVSGVAVQGEGNRWVSSFSLDYSQNGKYWYTYKEGSKTAAKVIHGNSDGEAVVRHNFISHFSARFVRFRPISWRQRRDECDVLFICMKVEIYGCKVCGEPLGLEDGTIANDQMTASSYAMLDSDTDFPPWRGRLNIPTRTWCAHENQQNKNQWLQIDLGRVMIVTGIATQGHWERRVTSYYLELSSDKRQWKMAQNKTFSGNTDDTTVVKHEFPKLIRTRYLRFKPQSWRTFTTAGNMLHVCLRAEVYGCENADKPHVLRELKDQTYEIGDKIVLTCTISGDLFPWITWSKDNSTIIPSSDVSHNAAVLTITNATIDHGGIYRCTVQNMLGYTYSEAKITIREPPKILEPPANLTVNASSKVTMNCSVRGEPWPTITWYKDDMMIGKGSPLVIMNTSMNNSGVYSCIASNSIGQKTKAEASLIINFPPKVIDTRVLHLIKYAFIPDIVLLDCPVKGHPRPRYRWTKDGKTVEGKLHKGSKVKEINSQEDYGIYVCQATNMLGSIQLTVKIKPTPQRYAYPPALIKNASNVTKVYAEMNATIHLYCPIKSNPAPELTWFKDGLPINHTYSEVLLVTISTAQNYGMFRCNASNFLGFETVEVELKPLPTVYQPQVTAQVQNREHRYTSSLILPVGLGAGVLLVIIIFALAWVHLKRREDARKRTFHQPMMNTTSDLLVSEEYISMNSRQNQLYQEVQSLTHGSGGGDVGGVQRKNFVDDLNGGNLTSKNIYEPR